MNEGHFLLLRHAYNTVVKNKELTRSVNTAYNVDSWWLVEFSVLAWC